MLWWGWKHVLKAWLNWNPLKIPIHLRLWMSIKYFLCTIFHYYTNTHIIINNGVADPYQKTKELTSKDHLAILTWYWATLLLQMSPLCLCHSVLEELLILILYDIILKSHCTLVMFNILLYHQMKHSVTPQEEKICLYDVNVKRAFCDRFYTQLSLLKRNGYVVIWYITYCWHGAALGCSDRR